MFRNWKNYLSALLAVCVLLQLIHETLMQAGSHRKASFNINYILCARNQRSSCNRLTHRPYRRAPATTGGAAVGSDALTTSLHCPKELKAGIWLVTHERTTEGRVPIFGLDSVVFQLSKSPPLVVKEDVRGVPGACMLHNVLMSTECKQFLKFSEDLGFDPYDPSKDTRLMACQFLLSEDVHESIFQRFAGLLPQGLQGTKALGFNGRWRIYKYGVSDTFVPHVDSGWAVQTLDTKTGELREASEYTRVTQMTCLLYLNDDFEGGHTNFYHASCLRDPKQVNTDSIVARSSESNIAWEVAAAVHPLQGTALCFFHGKHPLSPVHEGAVVTSGAKFIIQCDLVFEPIPHAAYSTPNTGRTGLATSLYDLPVAMDIDGAPFNFSSMQGKVVFAINVASRCSRSLVAYQMLRDLVDKDGFELLLFPCGQFGDSEFKTNHEIKTFIGKQGLASRRNVHIMAKGDVMGPHTQPVWKFFKGATGSAEPNWNFGGQYLVTKQGKVLKPNKGKRADQIDALLMQ